MPSTEPDPLYVYPNLMMPEYCVISENPEFGEFEVNAQGVEQDALGVHWDLIPALVADLERAHAAHLAQKSDVGPTFGEYTEQTPADGVVAAILLQTDPV